MHVLERKIRWSLSVCGAVLLLLAIPSPGSAAAATGQELFETNCAVCHGMDGTSMLPNAPHFSKGERLEKTNAQLLISLAEGLNIMPPWKDVLSEEDMGKLLVYVRSLAK